MFRTDQYTGWSSRPYRLLTDEQAAEIRQRGRAGESRQGLAAEFDVSASHVSRIVTGARRRDAQ